MSDQKEEAATPGERRAKVFVAKATDYQTVFGSEAGQRVLWDMFSAHHMMGTTFNADKPALQSFNEGERNVVLRILALLKTDPAKVQKLIRESDKHAEYLQTEI